MTKRQKISLFISAITLILILLLSSCTGAGIFAVVAVAEKIDPGILPEGISARPVVHINPDAVTNKYYFFASGPGLWAKDNTAGDTDLARLWRPISMNGWDGVQAMAATDQRIYLALYKVIGDSYTVGLFTLDSYDGANVSYTDLNKKWNSTSNNYQTVRLYCPDPAGAVYVNVLKHTGVYGSIDAKEDAGFTGSHLYRFDAPNTAADWTDPGPQPDLDGTNMARYITGVASNGTITKVLITATINIFASNGGILLNGNGTIEGDGKIDGSNVATTGITWIDRSSISGSTGDAFIVAATFLYDSTLPVFATLDDGATWTSLDGTSTDYLTTNFINVSDKYAGTSDSKHLVLAGTSSYIDGSTYRIASGYNEIDVTNDDPSTWVIDTSWDNYSLALKTNYSVSDLSLATIIGMSIPEDGNFLYASTRNFGIWKLNVDDISDPYPSWTIE